MLFGEPLVVNVWVLSGSMDAVCAEAVPKATARTITTKADFLEILSSWFWRIIFPRALQAPCPHFEFWNSQVTSLPQLAVAEVLFCFERRICNAVPEVKQWQ